MNDMVFDMVRLQRHLVSVIRKISNNMSNLATVIRNAERNHQSKPIVKSKINP
ncbi:hypothetical protein [Photorhabdus tasmaniensis]|uniref:hypothetical protein n=1 Tax=Photorhabdus tasmaniensis TaxID=1004159 RepID=UPI001409E02C|nr:hypothetical protein [Photorhabdus tasmaniensis]